MITIRTLIDERVQQLNDMTIISGIAKRVNTVYNVVYTMNMLSCNMVFDFKDEIENQFYPLFKKWRKTIFG